MEAIERTPAAILDFWMGPLRTAADTSRKNWQQGMLKWRVGPFGRSAENKRHLEAQLQWCHQMHREGLDEFFDDPVWETSDGWLAKLIVVDQFPRSAYRGTPLAYVHDSVTRAMAQEAITSHRDSAQYNVAERAWIYAPLVHAEDPALQEIAVDKLTRWSADLIADAPPEFRKINQFVTWAIVRATLEHAEALLSFGRFPHRNAVMRRPHRGGEPRYLSDSLRPLWSYTQPPSPQYFAVLGALGRMEDDHFDENQVTPKALAALLQSAGLRPEEAHSPMDVFDLCGTDTVAYPVLYRHLLLPEKGQALDSLRRAPLVVHLTNQVKSLLLIGENRTWPPKSIRHAVTRVIDIEALKAIVEGTGPAQEHDEPRRDDRHFESGAGEPREVSRTLSLIVRNDNREMGRVAAAVDEFADLHRFSQRTCFEVQLCVEELLMHIIDYGYDDAEQHDIRLELEIDNEDRKLVTRTVDDGIHLDPRSIAYRPESVTEQRVADGLGLHLVREYVDEVNYRREDERNHVSLSKTLES